MRRHVRYGLGLAAALAAAGCSDALEEASSVGQVIGVVNSGDNTLAFVSATDFTVRSVGLLTTTGTPTTLAARGGTLIVPLGVADSVAVVRNAGVCTGLCVQPVVVLPLASGSGATGVAIQDDSIAWIANPGLNTVTRINYEARDTTSVAVGPTPRAVATVGGVVYVVNANLSGSTPAGPSSITWFTFGAAGPSPPLTIPLTGTNAQFVVLGDDSLLYVVDRGTPGAADGKLSIVDPVTKREIVVINGLGESPGPAVFHPSGRLLIASATEGILEVYAPQRALTRGPGEGVKPGGDGVSGLAVDLRGRVYAVDPGSCSTPGAVRVLSAPPDYMVFRTVSVGVCPAAAAVAATP